MHEFTTDGVALVVEGGGLRGAYAVGVLRTLHSHLGPHYFDRIYAVSSGVFASTFYTAGQVDTMENTWRNLVHGSQLLKYTNLFSRDPILRLDYLIDLFQGKARLHLPRVMNSPTELRYIVTNYRTGDPEYWDPKNTSIFDLMRASAALPCVYPIPVWINNTPLFDGGQSDPIPLMKALEDGYNKIVVILTRERGYRKKPGSQLVARLCLRNSPEAQDAMVNRYQQYNAALDTINSPPNGTTIVAVQPDEIKIDRFTRSRSAIIDTINQGKVDAKPIAKQLNNFNNEPAD